MQAPFLEPTVSVKAIVEEISVEELDLYVARGCRKGATRGGWNAAKVAADAYIDLLQTIKASEQLVFTLQKILENSLTALQGTTPMVSKWRLRKPYEVEDRIISSAEVAVLMAMKVEDLGKEHKILDTVAKSLSLSTPVAELKAQLLVLKLRPYDNEEKTLMLQGIERRD